MLLFRDASTTAEFQSVEPDLSRYDLEQHDPYYRSNIPIPCSIYPERAPEYPDPDELVWLLGEDKAEEMRTTMLEMKRATNSSYFYELSRCPGTKVGGGGAFEQGGERWDHLATFSTYEFSAASHRRWLPLEDRPDRGGPYFELIKNPTGMEFGRTQDLAVWVRRETTPWGVQVMLCGG
jgi:hypothetical protein